MKVFVSLCADLFHAGHVRFLELAATYGDLYVSVGSDRTVEYLKGRKPIYNENERLYIISRIRDVKEAFIGSGTGLMDYVEEFIKIAPDIFIVNQDGDSLEKIRLCKKHQVEYIVLPREPKEGLPIRSTTKIIEDIRDTI